MSDTDPYAGPTIEYARNDVAAPAEVTQAVDVDDPQASVDVPVANSEVTVQVPEGSVKEILRWVGNDAVKAKAAIDAEKSGDNRSTLISKLEAIIN